MLTEAAEEADLGRPEDSQVTRKARGCDLLGDTGSAG